MDGGNILNFIGEKCAACGDVFGEDDDVVVCPECGTPHHRNCYMSAGKCANAEYHAIQKKWEREKKNDRVFSVCPICHFPNSNDAEFCERCGTDLNDPTIREKTAAQENNPAEPFSEMFDDTMGEPRPYLGFDPDEDLGGATVKEVSDFVRTNTIYYLPIFKRMKDLGSKLSFNLSCLVLPSLYFANRKMWGWAVLAVLISAFLKIPGAFIYMSQAEGMPAAFIAAIEEHSVFLNNADLVCSVVYWMIKLLFCLFGNSLYFKYILRSLKRIKASGGAYMAQKITSLGGVNPVNMILITLIEGVISVGIVYLTVYAYDITSLLNDLDSAAALGF